MAEIQVESLDPYVFEAECTYYTITDYTITDCTDYKDYVKELDRLKH